MRPIEIESRALSVLRAVSESQPYEDSRVELKAIFPIEDTARAARQIAGLANSAYGEPVFWIVGVCEKEGLLGVSPNELARWWPSVASRFDGVTPALTSLIVEYAEKRFQVLQFDTDRAPYLVSNPQGGQIQREVPWRDGNTTRTAKREELLVMLRPEEPLPEIEILEAEARLVRDTSVDRIVGTIETYIVPTGSRRLVIPFHRCKCEVISGTTVIADAPEITCVVYNGAGRGRDQAIVSEASKMRIEFREERRGIPEMKTPTLKVGLSFAGISRLLVFEVPLPHKVSDSRSAGRFRNQADPQRPLNGSAQTRMG